MIIYTYIMIIYTFFSSFKKAKSIFLLTKTATHKMADDLDIDALLEAPYVKQVCNDL